MIDSAGARQVCQRQIDLEDLLPSRYIKRRRLTDEVADTIREMILIGELQTSRRFTQQQLAEMVGVSTMPIREALLRLSHDGLITANPNHSYTVTPMKKSDLQDVYWLYSTIAGELTARACRTATPEFLAELRSLNNALLAVEKGQVEEIEKANWEFHRAINYAAQAPRLLHVLRGALRLIPEHFYALLPTWAKVNKRGHEQILQAVKNRDPKAGRAAGTAHALEAGQLIIAHFSESGYWKLPA